MDLSRPYHGIATTLDGDVLAVLAATTRPSSGRQVSRLVRHGSQPAVNAALDRLVRQGLVHREYAPPAMLYTLNRTHVGFPAVEALVAMRTEFLDRMRGLIAGWGLATVHASLFGSAARADGGVESDVDVVVVRPRGIDEEDEQWRSQLDELRRAVPAWTGNDASIVELAEESLPSVSASNPPVLDSWRRDAVQLAGRSLDELMGEHE